MSTSIMSATGQLQEVQYELHCSICHEYFIQAYTLSCSHSFCLNCINAWMENHNDCPICRQRILSMAPSRALDNMVAAFSNKQEQTVLDIENEGANLSNIRNDGVNNLHECNVVVHRIDTGGVNGTENNNAHVNHNDIPRIFVQNSRTYDVYESDSSSSDVWSNIEDDNFVSGEEDEDDEEHEENDDADNDSEEEEEEEEEDENYVNDDDEEEEEAQDFEDDEEENGEEGEEEFEEESPSEEDIFSDEAHENSFDDHFVYDFDIDSDLDDIFDYY